jgi:hypothetical protein
MTAGRRRARAAIGSTVTSGASSSSTPDARAPTPSPGRLRSGRRRRMGRAAARAPMPGAPPGQFDTARHQSAAWQASLRRKKAHQTIMRTCVRCRSGRRVRDRAAELVRIGSAGRPPCRPVAPRHRSFVVPMTQRGRARSQRLDERTSHLRLLHPMRAVAPVLAPRWAAQRLPPQRVRRRTRALAPAAAVLRARPSRSGRPSRAAARRRRLVQCRPPAARCRGAPARSGRSSIRSSTPWSIRWSTSSPSRRSCQSSSISVTSRSALTQVSATGSPALSATVRRRIRASMNCVTRDH